MNESVSPIWVREDESCLRVLRSKIFDYHHAPVTGLIDNCEGWLEVMNWTYMDDINAVLACSFIALVKSPKWGI